MGSEFEDRFLGVVGLILEGLASWKQACLAAFLLSNIYVEIMVPWKCPARFGILSVHHC